MFYYSLNYPFIFFRDNDTNICSYYHHHNRKTTTFNKFPDIIDILKLIPLTKESLEDYIKIIIQNSSYEIYINILAIHIKDLK